MIIDFFWIFWISFLCRASQVLLTGQFGMVNMCPPLGMWCQRGPRSRGQEEAGRNPSGAPGL